MAALTNFPSLRQYLHQFIKLFLLVLIDSMARQIQMHWPIFLLVVLFVLNTLPLRPLLDHIILTALCDSPPLLGRLRRTLILALRAGRRHDAASFRAWRASQARQIARRA